MWTIVLEREVERRLSLQPAIESSHSFIHSASGMSGEWVSILSDPQVLFVGYLLSARVALLTQWYYQQRQTNNKLTMSQYHLEEGARKWPRSGNDAPPSSSRIGYWVGYVIYWHLLQSTRLHRSWLLGVYLHTLSSKVRTRIHPDPTLLFTRVVCLRGKRDFNGREWYNNGVRYTPPERVLSLIASTCYNVCQPDRPVLVQVRNSDVFGRPFWFSHILHSWRNGTVGRRLYIYT